MITQHEKFKLPDENGKHDLIAEVNWKEDDLLTNESKVIKFTFPGGKTAYVKRDYLMSFLFAIGRAEDQRKLIPQKITKVRWYETVLSIKATKDIQKGEQVTFPIKISIPNTIDTVIGDLTKPKLTV